MPMRRPFLILLLALAAGPGFRLRAQAPSIPLALNDAIRAALEHNQNIKVEAYAPQIARANVLTALGQFDPALSFNREYSRNYGYPGVVQPLPTELVEDSTYSLALGGTIPTGLTYSLVGSAFTERGPYNNYTNDYASFGGINLTQPLLRGFGFGANLVNVRVAKANRAISKWDYRQTLINTVTNVIVGYSNLVLAHDELEIAQHSHDLAETLLVENREEFKTGNFARSEVTSARAQVAERDEAILLAENAVLTADNQLRQLMGETSFPPGRPLLTVAAPELPAVTVDPAKDLQVALAQRPDYQAARLGVTINRAQESAARNLLLPQVNLVASYGYNGLDNNFSASRRMVGDREYPASSIGVAISLPITNAVGRGTARAARLTREQAEEGLALLEAQIALNVANAGSQIDTAHQRVIADRAAYALASQTLDDETKKLRDGYSTTFAVVQAQQSLITVENSVAVATAAERQAVADYDQALGTTLGRYHIDLADK